MKKLFLAVALVAASLSASAIQWNFGSFTANSAGFSKDTVISNLLFVPGTAITNFAVTVTGQATKTISSVAFTGYAKTGGAGFTSGNDSIKPTARYFKFNTTAGSTVTVYFKTGSTSSAPINRACIISDGTKILAQGWESAGAGTTVTATTTAAGSIYVYGDNGITIYGIDATNVGTITAGIKDAISSDLLKKAGDALVNPTALSVEVYTVTGVKALTSNKTSINVSALPQGVYVAKTAKGTLKFIK